MRNLWLLLFLSAIAFAAENSEPWDSAQILEPKEIAKALQSGAAPRIFMVGPRILYNGNHIRGAIFAGPTGTEQGSALLVKETADLLKTDVIVLYCGCCPMDRCPNIRPAFLALKGAGFSNVRILRIPVNLPTDWASKGYPVEKGAVEK